MVGGLLALLVRNANGHGARKRNITMIEGGCSGGGGGVVYTMQKEGGQCSFIGVKGGVVAG